MCALTRFLSESLLTWLMEKEAELVVETDTPHDMCTQWAMLCAEVLMCTGVATGYALAAAQLCVFWGTCGASQPRVWNWCMDVCVQVWRVFVERWRTLAEGWEEAPPPWYSSVCHLRKSILSIASTHIPTGTSATLLLSHLNALSDAPVLLGFINDTLVSTYPPEPQNKVASMWLMRAATRVVDTCPVKRLCEVIGSL
jgi:hypothetical protein